jgi:hypothetical protein
MVYYHRIVSIRQYWHSTASLPANGKIGTMRRSASSAPWSGSLPRHGPDRGKENMSTYVLTIINCTPTLKIRPKETLHRALDAQRVWEIDTGHDLMITEPAKLAAMLLRLA